MEKQPVGVKSVFDRALEIESAAERKAYLDETCANAPELRQQVEALLKAHEDAGSFLQKPAPDLGATVDSQPGDESASGTKSADSGVVNDGPGRVIGPYKLLQQIGEGGMGTVFMAEQKHPVQRMVALKIIKAGMDSQQVIARFEAERQALALMDHPNIAKVLDAGTTETGRPYFVMELVKGVPITKYCDENHLTPKERLELFLPVCHAVQHAHQKGIIHRDIKPSNVMVCLYDNKPVPKVIDFGVAKATGQKLTDRTLFTEFGAVVGTLEYMSPEQAGLNQMDIDTRSDIYSLGVLLYELLTGTTPLERKRLKDAVLLELLRLIREEDSQKPSTRLSTTEGLPSIAANRGLEPKKLSGLMRGELDWIVMRALEKDRTRRYETANGLAADVRCYLADEPVQACPPSAWYRFRKFSRRNKATFTAATLVLMALVLGTVVSTWLAIWATTAEGLAEKRYESERLARTSEKAARDALDTAREEKDQQRKRTDRELNETLVEVAGLREQARTARPGDTVPWSKLRETMKRAETLAGSELADPVLVGRVRALTAEVKQEEADRRMVARLEEIHLNQGSEQGGELRSVSGATRPAYEAAFRDYGLPIFDLPIEEAARRIAASPIRDTLLGALDNCAANDWALCQRLLPIARLAEKDPWRQQYYDARIRFDRPALLRLAKQPEALAQPPATLRMLATNVGDVSMAGELLREVQRRNPGDVWLNSHLADWVRNAPGKPGQDVRQDMVGFRRAALAARPDSLALHIMLGYTLRDSGRFAEAIAVFEQVIRLKPDYSVAYRGRGDVHRVQRQWDKALADYNKAIELDPQDGRPFWARANVYSALREWDKVLADISKTLSLTPNQKPHGLLLALRGEAYQNLGLWEKATADHEEAVKVYPYYVFMNQLAWLLATCPEPKFRNPERSVQMAKKAVSTSGGDGWGSWQTLGVAHYRAGDWKEALAALNKSVQKGGPSDSINWFFLAMVYQKLGNRDEALKYYGLAVKRQEIVSKVLEKSPERAEELRAEELRRFRSEAEEVLELKKK